MLGFVAGYVKWRKEQERIREFYKRFGFNPEATRDEISRDYLARPKSERDQIEGAWYDLMMELSRSRDAE